VTRRYHLLCILIPAALQAASTHYDVKLTMDSEASVLRGRETIRFEQESGVVRWQKQAGLKVNSHHSEGLNLTIGDTSVDGAVSRASKHSVDFEYTATATRGFRWLTKGPGLFTAFCCDAWMICSTSPAERATLTMEIVVKEDGLLAVGPGEQRKHWRDQEGHHWLFETPTPVQTYLLSFAIAQLLPERQDRLEVFAPTQGHSAALRQTAEAVKFFRDKTGVDAVRDGYRQVFLPQPRGLGQEAAGLALMTEAALENLETKGDVILMAHELAHQWWGVSVGIRSWSDFWLNEGVAEYVSLLYLEHVRGHDAFLEEVEKLKTRFAELQSAGKDRPLHFEGWKDAADALGPLPYIKGALFLHRLRSQVGDELFWQGMALYTKRHAGALVDSSEFQRAFEEAAGVDLNPLFSRDVYGPK
jgi:aminopeptidase N